MPILFTCPHCGVQTNVADQYVGQSGPCASCGRTITIPGKRGDVAGYPPPAPSNRGTTALVAVLAGGVMVFLVCGGVLAGLLLPAVQAAREAARRAQCSNNLKQIGLAMHQYESQYGCFPPAYLPDKAGKPMHSWRVLLLPYLEAEPLYWQYRFDEPWDGPNNQVLTNLMPTVYRCPSDPSPNAAMTTNYVVITGVGTMFEGAKATSLGDIADGTSNTLLVVEVPGTSVHWMEPKDTTVEGLNQMLQNVFNGRSGHPAGFNALFCDGSVRLFSFEIDEEMLKLMIQKSDGQAIDVNDVNF